ncbi:MAG: hypothetical protein K2J63_01765 [Muribaculaceae bacterium]|nr:hypothetical protein [Muribaculaceae bacterium]MDE6794015.1 hypothetical protein [Muribaculaceae bacterium]
MTQLLVTLDTGADVGLLQRMIENMKGVLEARLSDRSSVKADESVDAWFNKLEALRKSYDPSYIDMNDERTQYILSK